LHWSASCWPVTSHGHSGTSEVPDSLCCACQARNELHELLAKPSLTGIPLLVLGNKNDLPTALSTNELIDRLELKVQSFEILTNRRLLIVGPFHSDSCSCT